LLSVDGKIAIVTGGTIGLGLAIARDLARNGATVIITSRKKSNLKKAIHLIDKNCYGFQLDLSKKNSISQFIENISKDFRHVDILINNAGFPFKREIWFKKIHDISSWFDWFFSSNQRNFEDHDEKKNWSYYQYCFNPCISGHICGSPYSIAKAGLISLTKHIALEYGQYSIRSYSVALGDVYTDTMLRSLSRSELVKAKNENTMKRLGQPEEVAKSIVSLAGENFSFSTGNTIIIDGGRVII